MPLVRISLRRGKSAAHLAALRNGIYRAMIDVFNVPENDRYILIHQHEAEEFDCDPHYLGIERSADLVIVQIACNNTRTVAQKQAFYRSVAEKLAAEEGVHALAVVPQVERRVEIVAARQRIVVARGVQPGLERETGEVVEQMTLVRDAAADDRHVVIGRQRDGVLHRDHGASSLRSTPIAENAQGQPA